MKHVFTLIIALLFCFSLNAEVRIHMEKEGGVYKVPCKVNGLKMKFIFDTGAATVCMSSSYAEMMLENGYLEKTDIKGVSQSTIADGSVIDNVVINLREIEIAGLTIENVTAIVVPTQNAPLLLGQSVIQKLGRVSIDGEDLVIHNANIYTEKEIESFYDKAESFFFDRIYAEALKYFRIVYDSYGDDTDPWVLCYMGTCYDNLDDEESAIKCWLKAIELDEGENEDNILFEVYFRLSNMFSLKKNYSKSLEYSKLMLNYANEDSRRAYAYYYVGSNYSDLSNYVDGLLYLDKSINTYKSILRKRNLDDTEANFYFLAYMVKCSSLESSHRYNDAIKTADQAKIGLEKYKKEHFYQGFLSWFNKLLSTCYNHLAN
ncbi:MAG: retroviral-like aspartic protease family protein [Muribaculaceae bacterium]|nr:retroviral-like aspartic protease family protein [Muribaculaceae bacterium]